MKSSSRRFSVALLLLASTAYMLAAEPEAAAPYPRPLPPTQQTRLIEGYGKLPLSFEPNQGQTNSQVKFLSRGNGYSLFLTSTEAVLSLRQKTCSPPKARATALPIAKPRPCETTSPDSVLRMKLLGSSPDALISGEEELPGKSNYFVGNNSAAWHSNISNYRKVQYRGVYPGVDLVYYGNQRQLEHDFIVAPGADPRSIRLRFNGAQRVSLSRNGDLAISTANGMVELHRPAIYQEIHGDKVAVSGSYRLDKNKQVGFAVVDYDRSLPLIIDPVLVYSTYFGGTMGSFPVAIATDLQGNAYITGTTASSDFPLMNPLFSTGPAQDFGSGFISKLNAEGSVLIYSTYFGPSSSAEPQAIAVDLHGNAYITGSTGSHDLPLMNAFQKRLRGVINAFVSKISADGSQLLYSTYLGGKYAVAFSIAVDAAGDAYVGGITKSGFPTIDPLFTYRTTSSLGITGFLTKLAPSGNSLEYSTYLGGTNYDAVDSVAVDALGEAIVTGVTDSQDFPVVNALYSTCILSTASATCENTFATKFNAEGTALVYSTFLLAGGGADVATNAAGDAFLTGQAAPGALPVVNALFPSAIDTNPFVMRLNPSGSAIVYSTYLGTTSSGSSAIAVDAADNAYIAGDSVGTIPVVNPIQSTRRGSDDLFIAEINGTGSALMYSTYLGGSGSDHAGSIAVDTNGNAYVTGFTNSQNFPLHNALQSSLSSQTGFAFPDGFIVKISNGATDFSITNTVDRAVVSPGGDLHYTITVTNIGSEFGSGVVSVTSERDCFRTCQVSNGDPCEFVLLGGRATVNLSLLAKGESRKISIYATAARTAGDYNLISNKATISSGPHLSQTAFASASVTVRETADIAITSSLVDDTNGVLHYVHNVTNLGPDNAHAVLLLNPLPANTVFVSASTTLGTCSFHPTIGTYGAVRCPVGNPAAGSTVQIDVVVQAFSASCPAVTNTATITSQSIDTNSGNDFSIVVTQLPHSICATQAVSNIP